MADESRLIGTVLLQMLKACVQELLRKSNDGKTLQEVLNTKTWRLRTSEKQSFWKLGDYFREKNRMVCFPFHVCSWTLFQTGLCESFV